MRWTKANWPVPSSVEAATSQRSGGQSRGCYQSLNLGMNCGDCESDVVHNRKRIEREVGGSWTWLNQVHGNTCVQLPTEDTCPVADAVWTLDKNRVCAVLSADCLPVLLVDDKASCIAAVHASWRSLSCNILSALIGQLPVSSTQLYAWLGPAISSQAFEVGEEVYRLFMENDPSYRAAFTESKRGHYFADLYVIAKHQLNKAGVPTANQYPSTACTWGNPDMFYSYRREGVTGRMVSWIKLS